MIGPIAGLSEYLMRAAAKNRQDNQWRSDEEATAPNRYYLPRPGERSPPSRHGAAPVGDALAGMLARVIAAPFVATHDMMQPPLRPPPDSYTDDSGRILVKRGNDLIPWQEADWDAAYAYYVDQQRRAEFAPRFALGMLGVGSNFAARGAAGMAGGRLSRPPTNAANLARAAKRAGDGAPSVAPAVPGMAALQDDAASPTLAGLRPTGQNHHGISKPIHRELEQHRVLAGLYQYQDRRFQTRAIDSDAHRGYQTWHRNLDSEIADHIRGNPLMTQNEFEQYLRDRYAEPDLLARFPNGF